MILTRRVALMGFAATAIPAALAKAVPVEDSFSTPTATEDYRIAYSPEERVAYHMRMATIATEEIARRGNRFWNLYALGDINEESRIAAVYWERLRPDDPRDGVQGVKTELVRVPV